MSTSELTLHFADLATVNVRFDGTDSGQLPFANPLQPKDRADLRWYIETYAASSLADPVRPKIFIVFDAGGMGSVLLV